MIDVKGQSGANFWRIKEKPSKPGLYYILTLVRLTAPAEFFIMREEDVRNEQEAYKNSGVRFDPRFAGFNWSVCKAYRDRWDILPR